MGSTVTIQKRKCSACGFIGFGSWVWQWHGDIPKPNKPLTAKTDKEYQAHLSLHAKAFYNEPPKFRWEALDYETWLNVDKRRDREIKLHARIEYNEQRDAARKAAPPLDPAWQAELDRIDRSMAKQYGGKKEDNK
jgi:hypothetical protein